ncbi:MAG: hypothetical protein ACLGG0_04160 [Bacteriovoracia bacterium]
MNVKMKKDDSFLRKRWNAEVFLFILFGVLLSIGFAQDAKGQILDLIPVSIFSLLLSLPYLFIAYVVNRRASTSLKAKDTFSAYGIFVLISFFLNLYLLSFINSKFDSSLKIEKSIVLGEGFERNDGKGVMCFRAKVSSASRTIDGDAFCTDRYPDLKEGQQVIFKTQKGFLGFEWYESLESHQ